MKPLDPLLRTHEVAERLQVSVSTVKRWVDAGAIQAVRTPGRHRKIAASEADRMARWLAEGGGAEGRTSALRLGEHSCHQLVELLERGDHRAAIEFVKALSRGGCSAATLADDLIRPVMEKIGHRWFVGTLDVFEEHQASHAIAAALHELIADAASRPASGPLAIGATTEGDPYVLSCLLGELVLREMGWEVRNLGVDLPLRSLTKAALAYRPRMVFLSINHIKDETLFAQEFGRFHEAAVGVGAAVIVGGRALEASLRSRLPYASCGERMSHLAAFARCLEREPAVERPRDEA